MEGSALAQSCVSQKTANQKVLKFGTNLSKIGLDSSLDITLSYELLSIES